MTLVEVQLTLAISQRHWSSIRKFTLSQSKKRIEFRDGGETLTWQVTVGEVDWAEPSDRVHRAVNVGKQPFEEVVTLFLDRPDAVPQPPDASQ
jgi:hypothetical protein